MDTEWLLHKSATKRRRRGYQDRQGYLLNQRPKQKTQARGDHDQGSGAKEPEATQEESRFERLEATWSKRFDDMMSQMEKMNRSLTSSKVRKVSVTPASSNQGVPGYLHSEPERSMLTGENTEPCTPQDVQPEPLPPSQTQGKSVQVSSIVNRETTQQTTQVPTGKILPLPFYNKKRSKEFRKNKLEARIWEERPSTSDDLTYCEWISTLVKDKGCESIKDGFGKEVVALSWLELHRRQQKKKQELKKIERLFTPSCDRPEDLFAFLSRDFDESDNVKYTLFAALLHELYTRGADVMQIFSEGSHILHYACYFGHIGIMRLLIEWEVDPNVVMPASKMTALHVICGSRAVDDEVCDKRVIDIFLDCNANLNAITEEGWTPLFKAVQAQKLETVKHLLGKCKKDDLSMVQHKDNNGDTPLHLAAKINAFSIVRELLDFAANADKVKKDAANQRDESPGGGQNDGTDEQDEEEDTEDRSLIGRSSCFKLITAVNSCGITPIHYASLHGIPDVQDGILSSCLPGSTSAESDDPTPKSCLEEMIAHVGSESTQLIVWYTKEDKDGQSALDYAASARRKDTFNLLWSEVEKCIPVTVSSIGTKLNHLVKQAATNPSNWVVVDDYLEKVPKAFIHTILETDSLEEKIYGSLQSSDRSTKRNVSQNTDHKSFVPQNCKQNLKKSNDPPSPLSLYKVLTADPGIYKEEHLDVVKKFLDGTIFGDEVVVGTTFDADKEGVYDEDSVNRSLTLNALLRSDLPVWGHTAIKVWICNNMWKFGWPLICFSLLFYLVFLGAVIGSLYLAAGPDITEVQLAQQYIGAVALTSQDMGRLFLEVIVLIYCFGIIIQVFYDLFTLRLKYFKLFTVYLRMSLIILLVILVVCRAAAIRGQWIVASLLFLIAMCMSTEFLVLFNFSGTYVLALWVIIRRDVLKFLAIAVILTFAFSGGIYLALRGERPDVNITTVPSVACMNVSTNDTGNINMTDCVPTGGILIVTNNQQEIFPLNELLIRNFETVTHGATIDYSSIFGVYSAILYLTFLVIILILMINALIAQISHSYDEAQDQASQLATYANARFLMAVYPVLPIFGRNRRHERFLRWTPGYRRTPCCCGIMKSTKIIWINRSILEDSRVNPEWSCLKKIGRGILAIFQAIFAAEGDVVAKISDDDDKWKKMKKDLTEHVDALDELIEKLEHSTSDDPDEEADLASDKAISRKSSNKMAISRDSTLEMAASDGKRKVKANTSPLCDTPSKPFHVVVEVPEPHKSHPPDGYQMTQLNGNVKKTEAIGDMEDVV